jgi:hypothetical protein
MRSRLLAATVGTVIGVCACTVVGEDTGTKLMNVEKGMTEQHVLGLVGPPAETSKTSTVCAEHGDRARVMLYGTKAVWFGGLFEGPFVESSYVCLDASSKVVGIGLIDY